MDQCLGEEGIFEGGEIFIFFGVIGWGYGIKDVNVGGVIILEVRDEGVFI